MKIDASPPVVTLPNYLDDDDDGDGVAEQPFRDPSFDVQFAATDEGSGLDFSSASCKTKPKGGGATTTNAVKGINSPNLLTCRVDNAPPGDVDVSLTITDVAGLETTVTRGFVVDAQGPR